MVLRGKQVECFPITQASEMDGARVLIPESRFDYLDVILSLLAVSVVLAICLRPQLCACGRSSSARRREAALAAALAASEGRGVANMTNEERIVFVNKNLVVEVRGCVNVGLAVVILFLLTDERVFFCSHRHLGPCRTRRR